MNHPKLAGLKKEDIDPNILERMPEMCKRWFEFKEWINSRENEATKKHNSLISGAYDDTKGKECSCY